VNNKPVISFIQQQKTQRIKPSSIWKKKRYHSGLFTKALYITAFIYPDTSLDACTLLANGNNTNAIEKLKYWS